MRLRASRVARAAGSIAQANVRRLTRPLKINLCVTYWCQYRCKTCNIWQRKPTDELTTDELLTFVRANADTAWLDVTGGEIFLRQDIEEILLAVVRQWRKLVVLHFPTNGFLTDRIVATASRLAAERTVPVVITVSLDGHEALNDEIRGIRGGYRRQIETFNRLRKISGVTAVLGLTVSRYNVQEVERIFETCRQDCPGLSIEDFHLNVAQRSAHYYGHDEASDFSAGARDVTQVLQWYAARRGTPRSPMAALEARYLRLLTEYVATGTTPMPCHALRSSCFIDPWGTVFPCITFDHPVGRLRETGMDLAPIWHGADARDLQREIWKGHCPQCWTACEAYQTILGNLAAPWRRFRPRPADAKTLAPER
jgi:radical SAM protein with 4Fe4S-binding SPASM domain